MIRLNELEEEIMDILWCEKKAFPKVIMSMLKEPVPPYNTVLSTIRKLEKLGYVEYNIYGKSHEYFPILKKEEYGRSIYKKLYREILDGKKSSLLSFFMKEEKVNIEELEKILNQLKAEKND
jgi:BlaI family transcriptional regulator, penicillinase repressor